MATDRENYSKSAHASLGYRQHGDLCRSDSGCFKPDRDDLRLVLPEKRPEVLSVGSAAGPVAEVVRHALADRLSAMTAENWSTTWGQVLVEMATKPDFTGAEVLL